MARFLLSALAICLTIGVSQSLDYVIVDTGVTTYSNAVAYITAPTSGNSFYGQDGNYAGNQPSYTDNGDGTVTDENTGLMWQQTMDSKMLYSAASSYASSLTLGGYSDWRIPTVKELYSLIQYTGDVSGTSAGTNRFIDTTYFDQPIGDTSAGEREIDAQTMSGSVYTGYVFTSTNKCNFGVNFVDGRVKCYPQRTAMYFRFVRGNTAYGTNSFTSNGDGTISDSATGLMWQEADSGSGMNWQDALAYCEGLSQSGYSDWRLPNAKELHSIVDYSRSPSYTSSPAMNALFTVSTVTEPDSSTGYPYYWSGTTLKDGSLPQRAVYFAAGYGYGAPSGTLIDVHGAGAIRCDPKSTRGQTYPQYFGPQLDLEVVYNYARCVRTI